MGHYNRTGRKVTYRNTGHQSGDENLAAKANNEKKEEKDPIKKSCFVLDHFRSKKFCE